MQHRLREGVQQGTALGAFTQAFLSCETPPRKCDLAAPGTRGEEMKHGLNGWGVTGTPRQSPDQIVLPSHF